jgi:hypothetical protein
LFIFHCLCFFDAKLIAGDTELQGACAEIDDCDYNLGKGMSEEQDIACI